MFSAKIKSEIIKGIIDVTSPLVNEAKFNITAKGISIRAVDPAHVAMVDLELKITAFEEYKSDGMELGIDLNKLNSVMKLATAGDSVSLEYDEESNRLIIKIGNLVRRMGLIDTAGMPDSKVPHLDLPAKVIAFDSPGSRPELVEPPVNPRILIKGSMFKIFHRKVTAMSIDL